MSVPSKFNEYKVVPDVISRPPPEKLEVTFDNTHAELGNVLTPTQVQNQPNVQWKADEKSFYTVVMIDPDAPSRKDPKYREWHHWLVVNVPGNQLDEGEVLTEYVGAGPPKRTGLHRYVILVYKQQGKIKDDDHGHLGNDSGENRGKFKMAAFAKKHHLGDPVAGNFFQAEWDEYVPKLYKQLSGE